MHEFLPHLRKTYRVRTDREGTVLYGHSMGGLGALLLGFKHPDQFAALAAVAQGINPALRWEEMRPKDRFLLSPAAARLYGSPVDPEYWAAHNPASIAHANPDRIRQSGLQIYIEAGDLDSYWMYEGAEFLHQVLWNVKIPHEYHLVRGGDHQGATLPRRRLEAMSFLGRVLAPQPDPVADEFREQTWTNPAKRRLDETDHYGLDRRP